MATKKKTARKAAPATRNKKSLKPSTDDEGIPEGFTVPASAQVPNWNYEKQKVLIGDIVAIKTIKKKKPRKGESPTTQLMTVREESSGNLYQVWESATLRGLFEEAKKGAEVYIRYDGLGEKVKGKNQAKLFTVAYKNPGRK